MANDTQQFDRYSSPFVLDEAKLTRILTVIEERFGEANFEPGFDVTLKNGKQVKVSALDALLKLDNTIKTPVTSLDISAQSNDVIARITFDDFERKNIQVGVQGSNPKLVGELFAELEEQVERTMVGGWFSKLVGSGRAFPFMTGLLVTTLFALGTLIGVTIWSSDQPRMGLTVEAADQVRQALPKVVTNEDKINWLFDLHRRQLESAEPDVIDIRKFITWQNFFLALPVIVVAGCLVYLRLTCYPRAVFLWGDWEEHYKSILSKRRTVWVVIIGALVVGVISSLFVSSFQRFIPNK